MGNVSKLLAARLYWQTGSWEKLAAIDVVLPGASAVADDDVELALYKSQAMFQIGEIEDATKLVRSLDAAGVSRKLIRESLWSGANSSLARGWLLAENKAKAKEVIETTIAIHVECGDPDLVAELRYAHERTNLGMGFSNLESAGRKLFLDCGGFDGCSALMFLLSNPEFECISFEPNPDMWRHFKGIPTKLVKKAVYTYDGTIDFTVDPVDGDGSTLVSGKKVDYTGSMENTSCPVISVPCVDLSRVLEEASAEYDVIVLKLDVEGAEYDILEKILGDGTISVIDKLYCEFHAHKMEIEEGRHERVMEMVKTHVDVEKWDALPLSFSVEETPALRKERRKALIKIIQKARSKVGII